MASTKEYRDFILEQLAGVSGVSCRPMMGEFLLYLDGCLVGGIYDDRLLLKITPSAEPYKMPKAIPYPNAKPMYLVEEVDDKALLKEILFKTYGDLSNGKEDLSKLRHATRLRGVTRDGKRRKS